MISSLTIEGFQCHQHLELELDPHCTVLTGNNGVGKSAVVRALKWLALNIWDGKADQMITWDTDKAVVVAKVGKDTIVREKGPKTNLYILNGNVLEAVGVGKVPDPVARIINMTEESFQEQLDPAFWFNLTAGQVAKSLNKIVNLSSIDTSLDNVASELRTAREAVKVTEQRITEATNIKESLAWTVDQDAKLKELEALDASIEEKRSQIEALASVLAKAREMSVIRQNAAKTIQSGQKAIEAWQECSAVRVNTQKIRDLIYKDSIQERQLCEIKARLAKAEKKLTTQTEFLCSHCGGSGLKSVASS
jgi:DNA repair protein SbcC/Rad50